MLVGAIVEVAVARGLLVRSELVPLVGRGSRAHITVQVPGESALCKRSLEHLDLAVTGQCGPQIARSCVLGWVLRGLGLAPDAVAVSDVGSWPDELCLDTPPPSPPGLCP